MYEYLFHPTVYMLSTNKFSATTAPTGQKYVQSNLCYYFICTCSIYTLTSNNLPANTSIYIYIYIYIYIRRTYIYIYDIKFTNYDIKG